MSEEDSEVEQIDAELALRDVIHIVFKYIKAKDLFHMSQMCKSWREAAKREKGRRCYDQQLRLPYKINNVANMLDITPYVSLLIYDSKVERSLFLPAGNYVLSNGFEEELLEDFKPKLPNNTIVLRVDMCLSTDDLDAQGNIVQRNDEHPDNCEIMGLFFPSMKERVRVDVAWMNLKMDIDRCHKHEYVEEFFNQNPEVIRFAEDLCLPDSEDIQSTILLLTSPGIEDHTPVLSQLRESPNCKKDHKITWASICGTKLAAGNRDDDHSSGNLQTSAALRFSGPNVDSCSTFIFILASREEILLKLEKLKEQLKCRKHYVGFLYSINCVNPGCEHLNHPSCNSREIMYNLKITFPNIHFKGFFKNLRAGDSTNCFRFIADRSDTSDAFDEELLRNLQYYASIIIISYD